MSLPEITDEDRAVAADAWRLYDASDRMEPAIAIAAALVRTGWKPVDPDLILAREVCAERWQSGGLGFPAATVLAGDMDNYDTVAIALAAIKAADARRKGGG
jgi:hypothetical protein